MILNTIVIPVYFLVVFLIEVVFKRLCIIVHSCNPGTVIKYLTGAVLDLETSGNGFLRCRLLVMTFIRNIALKSLMEGVPRE
jgi:hypothetical protein